jgi:hypothetical protein
MPLQTVGKLVVIMAAVLGLAVGWRYLNGASTEKCPPRVVARETPTFTTPRSDSQPARVIVAPAVSPAPPVPRPIEDLDSQDVAASPRVSDDLQDYRDFLQFSFDQDGRDRTWEANAETRIRSGASKLEAMGTHIESVECRANLCKLVLANTDANAIQNAKLRIAHEIPWPGPRMAADGPQSADSDFRVTAFFGREGRELPDG